MSKYVLPPKSWYGLGEVREPRQVFDTLEEAAAAYKSGLFGPMLEWKGPFSGPFPHCQEWHGYSSAVVTGMGPFPPDCIYEIDVETTKEAEHLYDHWRYFEIKAEVAREAAEMPRLKNAISVFRLEGECTIVAGYEWRAIVINDVDIFDAIVGAFLDVPNENKLDGFKFGPVAFTFETSWPTMQRDKPNP